MSSGDGSSTPVDPQAPVDPEVPIDPEVPVESETPVPSGAARRRSSSLRELPVLALVAVVLAALVKTFLLQVFFIPSGSMEPTLANGDRVLVDKVGYRLAAVSRGDVVVFDGAGYFGTTAAGDHEYVKRVLGVAGDRVTCCDSPGRVLINGTPLEEPYLHPDGPPSELAFDVEVPAGRVWLLGDHRSRSADSRSHLGDPGGGMVPTDRVVGRVVGVIWPLGRARLLEDPESTTSHGAD
ncbi:MAG: signal peptidase I [Actinomycetota bacterium]|nr:signal peptidase I [Actinomycetota bacterium]